jgi:hypothetical protein
VAIGNAAHCRAWFETCAAGARQMLCNHLRRELFLATLADGFFLADFFFADLELETACGLITWRRRPSPKIFSQLLEYCVVAPTRVIVITL